MSPPSTPALPPRYACHVHCPPSAPCSTRSTFFPGRRRKWARSGGGLYTPATTSMTCFELVLEIGETNRRGRLPADRRRRGERPGCSRSRCSNIGSGAVATGRFEPRCSLSVTFSGHRHALLMLRVGCWATRTHARAYAAPLLARGAGGVEEHSSAWDVSDRLP